MQRSKKQYFHDFRLQSYNHLRLFLLCNSFVPPTAMGIRRIVFFPKFLLRLITMHRRKRHEKFIVSQSNRGTLYKFPCPNRSPLEMVVNAVHTNGKICNRNADELIEKGGKDRLRWRLPYLYLLQNRVFQMNSAHMDRAALASIHFIIACVERSTPISLSLSSAIVWTIYCFFIF